jgi:hypothetical protein
VNIEMFGNTMAGMSYGVVRSGGTPTISLKSAGNNLASGAWIVVPSGTPVLSVYGFDISTDVGGITGLGKTTSGMYCFNSGAARGTLVQNRLVTCNGTNWVQVDTPANVF